jgi:enamine deaminase RidA (YjgF/YER057c/UK114 family)
MIERHVQPDGSHAVNGFAHCVVATGRHVYAGGQVALDADGQTVGEGDMTAQVEQVFANLKNALAAGGATLADVVKMTYYLTDIARVAELRAVRDRHLGLHLPASVLVEVSAMANPAWMVEIDAIAVVDPTPQR